MEATASRIDNFIAALNKNYIVNKGCAKQVDPAFFVKEHVIDSAAGNNANQPYKRLQIPENPFKKIEEDNSMGIFRLEPYEAIIYLGPTPPTGDYFSFTPFLWERRYGKTIEKGDWIFAALGDPLNNATIKTEGDGSTFQKETLIIFTADQGVNNDLMKQATAAGYPETMINTYVIPSFLLKMGLDHSDDSFLILVRTANIYDKGMKDFYYNHDHYASVLRITPRTTPQLQPYFTPSQRNRKATPEELLVRTPKSLTQSLDDLQNAILAQTPHLQYKCFDSIRWFAESRDVLEAEDPQLMLYHKFVAGEASDTPYLRSALKGVAANFTLKEDEMVIVFGVNHQATNLATYSNFSVYGENILDPPYIYGHNDPIWSGVIGLGSKDSADPINGTNDFDDSARQFLPNDPNIKYLYAAMVVRAAPAAPPPCPYVVVPVPANDKDPASGIALDAPVAIGYRAYLNPATDSGPSYEDIVPDRAIWFKVK